MLQNYITQVWPHPSASWQDFYCWGDPALSPTSRVIQEQPPLNTSFSEPGTVLYPLLCHSGHSTAIMGTVRVLCCCGCCTGCFEFLDLLGLHRMRNRGRYPLNIAGIQTLETPNFGDPSCSGRTLLPTAHCLISAAQGTRQYACLLENQTPRTEPTCPCALCTRLCQTLHVVLGTCTKGGHQNSGVTSEWQTPW